MILNLPHKRALVVAPHADDEVLGAGGTMALLSTHGWTVHVAYIAVGGYFSHTTESVSSTSQRVDEIQSACRVLGVTEYTILYLGEEYHLCLDRAPQKEMIAFIEQQVEKLQPSLLLLPFAGHFHQDHRATSKACIAALRPGSHCSSTISLALAYGTSTPWWSDRTGMYAPDTFVDITSVVDAKEQALRCYASQIARHPHPRSIESVRAYAASWGAFTGCSYAEAFEIVRCILYREQCKKTT